MGRSVSLACRRRKWDAAESFETSNGVRSTRVSASRKSEGAMLRSWIVRKSWLRHVGLVGRFATKSVLATLQHATSLGDPVDELNLLRSDPSLA